MLCLIRYFCHSFRVKRIFTNAVPFLFEFVHINITLSFHQWRSYCKSNKNFIETSVTNYLFEIPASLPLCAYFWCRVVVLTVVLSLRSLMIILQVMSVKALGISLKLTFDGNNQLIFPETWFFMCVVAICVIMQMNYLNKASIIFSILVSLDGEVSGCLIWGNS